MYKYKANKNVDIKVDRKRYLKRETFKVMQIEHKD